MQPQPFFETLAGFIRTDLVQGGMEEELTEDTPLVESGLVDSLSLFMLIGFVQKTFGVEIRPDEIIVANFATIRAIEHFVASKRREQGA